MRIEKALRRVEALRMHCLNMAEIAPSASDTWEQDAEALTEALRLMRREIGAKESEE